MWKGGWKNRKVPYDTNFGTDDLEWLVENPEDFVITGLMIRKDQTEPKQFVLQKYYQNKAILASRPKDDGTWYWNSGTDRTLSNSGPWQAYLSEHNTLLEKAYKAGQIQMFLGKIDTVSMGELIYFINFDVMEQVRCSDNSLRRKIKRVPIIKLNDPS